MTNGNYDEIRRVRHEMSQKCDHDARKLIQMINEMTKDQSHRIISPGNLAEQCGQPTPVAVVVPNGTPSNAAG